MTMKINVYNQAGEEVGTTLLPKEIFEVEINPDLVHQVVVSQAANRRKVIAHTKTRGEVRGGGRKPWRQKGTGRARHGSRRSPIWVGGGVAFGPRNDRIFTKKINKKMRRSALYMILSAKAKNNFIFVLDKIELEKIKTKTVAQILNKLPMQGTALIVLPRMDKNIILSARNIAGIETVQVKDLNALDLLSFKYLVMLKESIAEFPSTARMEKETQPLSAKLPHKKKEGGKEDGVLFDQAKIKKRKKSLSSKK